MKRKALSVILALCMIFSTMSCIGLVAFAEGTAVAQVGSKTYATLEEALATGTSEITLLDDVALDKIVYIKDSVELDLAGHKITPASSKLTAGAMGDTDALICVNYGGYLYVKDTVGGGAIDTGANASIYAAIKLTSKGEKYTEGCKAATLIVDNGCKIAGYYYGIVGHGSRHNTDTTIVDAKITSYAPGEGMGIYHPQDGVLKIYDGEIIGHDSAVEMRAGTLDIWGGTLTATADTYSVTPQNSGSTTVGAAVAVAQHNTGKDISVKIRNATLTGLKAVSVADPQGKNGTNVVVALADNATYNGDIEYSATSAVIEGYGDTKVLPAPYGYEWVFVSNGKGGYVLQEKDMTPYVAKIDSAKYTSLAEAFEAVESGDVITLLDDVQLDTIIYVDKDVYLDLDGYKITPASSTMTPGALGDKDALFCVKYGGHLRVYDNVGTGAIDTGANPSIYAAIKLTSSSEKNITSAVPASVTIEGGTIAGYYYGLVGNGARHNTTMEINAGTIKANSTDGDGMGIYNPQEGTVKITGGTIIGHDSAIEMRAGTLDISGGTLTATATEYKVSPSANGSTTVGAAVAVAQHNTGKNIKVNITGGTITGLNAVSVADPQNKNLSNVRVNLGNATYNGALEYTATQATVKNIGTTLAAPEGYAWTEVDGEVILAEAPIITAAAEVDGVLYDTLEEAVEAAEAGQTVKLLNDVALTTPVYVNKSVTLDLNGKNVAPEGTTLTAGAMGDKDALFCVNYGGNLTVKDSVGTGSIDTGVNPAIYAAVKLTSSSEKNITSAVPASVTIDGGKIAGYYYGIVGNGARHNTAITINDGYITSTNNEGEGMGIYNPQEGTVEINGGTIIAHDSAIEMRAGKLTVNGGTLIATADEYKVAPSGSGSTTVGAAVAIAQHNTGKDIVVNINNGTIIGEKSVSVADPQNKNLSNVEVSLGNATYSGELAYTADEAKVENIGTTLDAPSGYEWTEVSGETVLAVVTPEIYNVTVSGGATISKVLNPAKSAKYEIATVKIAESNGINASGDWFVYWKDQDGNIVSTYSTYSFFAVENRSLTPVYVSPDVYETERAKAILVTDIVRTEDNGNGTATIFAEHSASKAAVGGAITQHGIVYTTDAAQMGALTIDNDNVNKSVAAKTNAALTGMFRTVVNAEGDNTVYARSYMIDANGNVAYGDVKTISVLGTSSVDSEEIICSSLEFTTVQADEVIPTEGTETETAPSIMSYITSIINAIMALIQAIIALF